MKPYITTKWLPTAELAENIIKAKKAPPDVQCQYTKHLAVLVSTWKSGYMYTYVIIYFFIIEKVHS